MLLKKRYGHISRLFIFFFRWKRQLLKQYVFIFHDLFCFQIHRKIVYSLLRAQKKNCPISKFTIILHVLVSTIYQSTTHTEFIYTIPHSLLLTIFRLFIGLLDAVGTVEHISVSTINNPYRICMYIYLHPLPSTIVY